MGKDCKKKCKPNQKCDKTTGKCVMKDDRCSQFKQAPYVNPATGNKISKDGILNLKIRKILRYD
jgi:hypothetical protein